MNHRIRHPLLDLLLCTGLATLLLAGALAALESPPPAAAPAQGARMNAPAGAAMIVGRFELAATLAMARLRAGGWQVAQRGSAAPGGGRSALLLGRCNQALPDARAFERAIGPLARCAPELVQGQGTSTLRYRFLTVMDRTRSGPALEEIKVLTHEQPAEWMAALLAPGHTLRTPAHVHDDDGYMTVVRHLTS